MLNKLLVIGSVDEVLKSWCLFEALLLLFRSSIFIVLFYFFFSFSHAISHRYTLIIHSVNIFWRPSYLANCNSFLIHFSAPHSLSSNTKGKEKPWFAFQSLFLSFSCTIKEKSLIWLVKLAKTLLGFLNDLRFLCHSLLLCFCVHLTFTLSFSAFLKLSKWTLELSKMLFPLL